MNALFFGPAAQSQGTAGAQDDITCPPVDIRPGTSTMAVNASGDASAMTLRYQATIARTARECAVLGATMTIKVGVHGRIILGPAGGPGRLDAPIRIALVQEGPEPKTIWTKLYRVPVTIPAGQSHVNFVHVEEDLTVPTPPPADVENYIVYVGFDQTAPNERPARRSRRSS